MFQFTTTNVVNSLDWQGKSDALIQKLDDKSGVIVKGVGTFRDANVQAAYRADFVEPAHEELTIDLTDIAAATPKGELSKGDVLRLQLYIGLSQASQESLYANDFYYKGRPWSIEFEWQGDASTTAEYLAKIIKKYQVNVVYQTLMNVEADGAKVVLTAVDEYQRFRKASIELYDETFSARTPAGDYIVLDSLIENLGAVKITKEGNEGFCTSRWLLHNVRIPTSSRTHFAAINQEESPIPGVNYVQFTIHYCVNRGILGTNAVGDLVRSLTTHVFYVRQDLADEFAGKFGVTFLPVGPGNTTAVEADDKEAIVDFDKDTKAEA